MPRRRLAGPSLRRGRKFALAALVPALLAGCTAGPAGRPPVVANDGPPPALESTGTELPLPPLAEPRDSSIEWSDCDEETRERTGQPAPDSVRFDCAKVTSRLDPPDLPGRGQIRVALLKAGSGPVPLVVVNDIDGEPGTLFAAKLAATLPPEVLQRFSLIGVDRRGTGQSSPVSCVPGEVRWQLVGQDPVDPDPEPLLDAARKAGQQCTIELTNEQQALDSWRTAGDLEEIRDQLGVPKLNALSRGEGSKVLTAYSTRYADRIGRMVLDGIPDPSQDTLSVLDGVAAGAQSTLDAFGRDCVQRGCALGADASGAVLALAEQLRQSPRLRPEGTFFGPSLALYSVATGLAQRARWPELADAIAAARGGDLAKLAAFTDALATGSRLEPAQLDATLATKCNDTATRLPADQFAGVAGGMQAKYPVFGGLVAQQLAWCSPWPVRREPLPPAGGYGAPPMLVTSSAADPVTPELGTIRAADQLPNAIRVSWQGAGHGALSSSCVSDAVRAFLVDGKVPSDGTLCPA
ncbi:alpha/beta hydrolase [Amycolatopsis nigrescens]|uniref:alpha/beta hydrolase n=1 Tax=Amycolatopsis nigrescens TaxID=381445 RepID=UPI0003814296|nr:alpha/beta hydrolase [Amycolatopsis nigrescens]